MLKLRDYQDQAVQSIFRYFQDGNAGNPLIVAPTGSGKSLIIAAFIKQVLELWPNQRILVLAHRKELLEQNAQELWKHWPGAPIGIYSAGLGIKSMNRPVTIAGIASIVRRIQDFRPFDLVLVDEAHLVPTNDLTMYRTVLAELFAKNPSTKVIGLTATPFRLESGFLHEGEDRLFTNIAFNIDLQMLVKRGFLAPLVSKISTTPADLSGCRIRKGEFLERDVQAAFNKDFLIESACDELIRYGYSRKSWLIFAAGVEHAHKIKEALRRRDIAGELITAATPKDDRRQLIADFRAGKLRCIINCNVLTTGFNAPNIDLIGVLRATQSAGLYIQILGRGMRTFAGKKDCLVLDFGENLERHGPIDKIVIRSRRNSATGCEENTVERELSKACPSCRSAIPIAATECKVCGHLMPREVKHETEASTASPMSEFKPPAEFQVQDIEFRRNPGKGNKPDSFQITYFCGLARFSEWLCFEHGGPAAFKAGQVWRDMHPDGKDALPPETVEEALQQACELKRVSSIWVNQNDKFPRVVSRVFGEHQHDECADIFEEIGI